MRALTLPLIFTVYCLLLWLAAGCTPAVHLTPHTQAAIAADQQSAAIAVNAATTQGAVSLAKEQAQRKLQQAQGRDDPLAHPVSAVNDLVLEIRPWLMWAAIVAGGAFIVALALSLAGFALLPSVLLHVLGWLFALLATSLVVLPILPWGILVVAAAAAVLLAIELPIHRGNVPDSIDAAESLLGLPDSFTIGAPATAGHVASLAPLSAGTVSASVTSSGAAGDAGKL